jgi:hypothetical protein
MTAWTDEVSALTDRLAGAGLGSEDVAAIGAGLRDVSDGLGELLKHVTKAINLTDRDAVIHARVEVDDHMRPHLRDLSKALRSLDRLLAKKIKDQRKATAAVPRLKR